jgi:ADP-ribose pyrophosphatase
MVAVPSLPAHPDVVIEGGERVWSGRFPLDVVRFRHRRFDGAMSPLRTWELWRRGRAAAVLPYDPVRDAVVLIEQFRLPALAARIDPVMVELPAGLCDGEEPPEATAHREMGEEMGLASDRLEHITDVLLTPGGADEYCRLFVGRVAAPDAAVDGVAGAAGLAAEHEDIRIRVWPAAEAEAAALSGRFANSVTVIGLLWLALRRAELRHRWIAT